MLPGRPHPDLNPISLAGDGCHGAGADRGGTLGAGDRETIGRRSAGVTQRWRPAIGSVPGPGGVRFEVWAPASTRVEVVVERTGSHPLARDGGGYHAGLVPGIGAGVRYRF